MAWAQTLAGTSLTALWSPYVERQERRHHSRLNLCITMNYCSSVRIPGAFCGLYSLRPSYERLPYANAANAQEGQESISSTLGPMANSLSAVKRFTKAIIDGKPWRRDPLAVRKPWNDEEYALADHGYGVGLCFAIMWDNNVIKPHPPLTRAMEITKKALQAAGHKGERVAWFFLEGRPQRSNDLLLVIDWMPHRHMEIYKIGVRRYQHRPSCTVPLTDGDTIIRNSFSLLTVGTTIAQSVRILVSRSYKACCPVTKHTRTASLYRWPKCSSVNPLT